MAQRLNNQQGSEMGQKDQAQHGSERGWMMKTQQLAGIGKGVDDKDSTISRDWKEDKGLNV
eukprot:10350011-Ditylum_brightwellii.AAC.1